jgi:inner membrane protein
MTAVAAFLVGHPPALWLAAAAILLAVEVATGTGWLLWAAGSAGAVAIVAWLSPLGLPLQLVAFAVLTAVTSLLARRFLPHAGHGGGDDINDNMARLIGRQARVVAPFSAGRGRVAIDGKEWAAVLISGEPAPIDGFVEVAAASGAELSVRGA